MALISSCVVLKPQRTFLTMTLLIKSVISFYISCIITKKCQVMHFLSRNTEIVFSCKTYSNNLCFNWCMYIYFYSVRFIHYEIMQCFKWAYRWSCLPSFWRSAPCWKCMQTSCPIQTFSWPSPMAPARWTAWSGLWSITSLPSTKVAKVPLPRSPTTPSSERPSTALGMYPKRQRLRQQS